MKLTSACLAVSVFLAASAAVHANDPHAGHDMQASSEETSASSQAFEAVNMKMHKDMRIVLTGDADADFVRGMMPHHQGAIDMANVVIKYGKDAQIRKLAEQIIKAQEGEIAMMKTWLAANGK